MNLGSLSAPQIVVKTGTARVFNPSLIAKKTYDSKSYDDNENWDSPEDGVFLDRNMQLKLMEEVSYMNDSQFKL